MRNWAFFLFILIIGSCSDCSGPGISDAQIREQAVREARQMSDAYIKKEYKKFVSYSPPILIEGLGGADRYIEYLELLDEQNSEEQTQILDIQIGKVLDISKEGTSIQVLLEQKVHSKLAGGRVTRSDSLIGVREGMNDDWKFLNVGGVGDSILRVRYPYLHENWDF